MDRFEITSENGQSMVEYGFVLLLVALAAVGALSGIGPDVSAIFSTVDGGF